MTNEKYVPWPQDEDMPARLEIASLRDDEEGLTVDLANESSRELIARVRFVDFVAYRNINESFRHRTWRATDGAATGMTVVEGSSWLQWLRAESDGVLDEENLVHYAIYTGDDCLDVASRTPPVVEPLRLAGPAQ